MQKLLLISINSSFRFRNLDSFRKSYSKIYNSIAQMKFIQLRQSYITDCKKLKQFNELQVFLKVIIQIMKPTNML